MTVLDSAHVFGISVGGNDVSSYLVHDSLKMTSALTHEIDVADFVLEDADGTMPRVDLWQEVVVVDEGATRAFAGYCTRLKRQAAKSISQQRATLYCQDYGVLLKTVVVDSDYTDQTDEAVLDDLFTTYLGEITTVNVTASVGVHSFVFDNITLYDAVQQIAKRTRSQWRVDYSKDLHYWQGTTPDSAAYEIDTDAPDWATSYLPQEDTLSIEDDGEGLVNRVIVRGGQGDSAIQTDTFSGDGAEAEFFLSNPGVGSIVNITVGGAHQTWATDFVIYTFTDVDVLVNYHRGRVRWDAADPPAVGVNNIVVKYTYRQPVAVTRNAVNSQTYYGRVITRVVVNRDISTVEEAEAYGDAYLSEHSIRRRTGRVNVERYGLGSGEALGITCTAIGLDADRGAGVGGCGYGGCGGDTYVTQTVTTRPSRRGVEHSVTFAEFQPSLGELLRDMTRGDAGTGGISGGAGWHDNAVVGLPPGGNVGVEEASAIYGGTLIVAADLPSGFSWNPSYGSATGVILGLDTTKTPPAGKLIIVQGGLEMAAMGDLNGHYGYTGSTFGVGLGQYSVDDYMTIDSTNGIRFLDSGDVVRGQFIGSVVYLGDQSDKYIKLSATNIEMFDGATKIMEVGGASSNALIGADAGDNLSTGTYNTLFGTDAGYNITTGDYNVSVGYQAIYGDAGGMAGDGNVGLGYQALYAVTTGHQNIAAGTNAGYSLTTGLQNVLMGFKAGYYLTTADSCVALGVSALYGDAGGMTGDNNVAVGFHALDSVSSGTYNIGIGANSLGAVTTGGFNIGVGDSALSRVVAGHLNTAVGYWAGRYTTGQSNALFGAYAGTGAAGLTTAGNLVAVGRYALYAVTTGTGNTAVGHISGWKITEGTENTLLGAGTGLEITTGDNNILIGSLTGAVTLATGSSNILIGDSLDTPAADTSNYLNIGDLLYGNTSTGKLGIGAAGPNSLTEWNMTTENLEFVDAGSAAATEQDWIEVEVGGNTGYIRVFAAK